MGFDLVRVLNECPRCVCSGRVTSRLGLDSIRFVTSTRAMATDDDGATTTTTTTTSKIYTKTGDGGSSCLYNMERRDKDDAAFEALGDVDECNVAVGIAREFCLDEANGLEAEVRRRWATRAREGEVGSGEEGGD